MNKEQVESSLRLAGEIDEMVGCGKGKLIVYFMTLTHKKRKTIPKEWEGFPVEIQHIGKIRPAT